eukprot:366510-Chlamydomonas_euryale.AAC.5
MASLYMHMVGISWACGQHKLGMWTGARSAVQTAAGAQCGAPGRVIRVHLPGLLFLCVAPTSVKPSFLGTRCATCVEQ